MSSGPLDRIAQSVVDCVSEVLPGVTAGTPIILPRGADPFAGSDRPLLLTATRWTPVSPGGVVFGGEPSALATVLGFELPPRPEISTEDAQQQRRATDADDGDGGDAEVDDAEPEPAEPEPAEPASDADGDADAEPAGDAVDGDAASGEAAPAPARRWSDHVADAARERAAAAGDGVIRALAALVGLPPGAAATHAVLAESDALVTATVGPLPDAVVVPLHHAESSAEARLIIVVAGIISARVAAAAVQVGSASGPGAAPVEAAEAVVDAPVAPPSRPVAVGGVPLDLSAELGTTRLPLSSVLALRDGAVIELSEAVEAPVALVAGATPVATGELELDDDGSLVLHVTGIPGRPDLTPGPALVAPDTADDPSE